MDTHVLFDNVACPGTLGDGAQQWVCGSSCKPRRRVHRPIREISLAQQWSNVSTTGASQCVFNFPVILLPCRCTVAPCWAICSSCCWAITQVRTRCNAENTTLSLESQQLTAGYLQANCHSSYSCFWILNQTNATRPAFCPVENLPTIQKHKLIPCFSHFLAPKRTGIPSHGGTSNDRMTWNKSSSMWFINLLRNRSRKENGAKPTHNSCILAFLHWFGWKIAFWCILQLSNSKLTNLPISLISCMDAVKMTKWSNDVKWLRSHVRSAWLCQLQAAIFFSILLWFFSGRSPSPGSINSAAPFPHFEANIASNCKRVSQYHLKWSFASLTKTWQKDQSFSGLLWALSAHIEITCSDWNLKFRIRINLCGSILGSATSSQRPVHGAI